MPPFARLDDGTVDGVRMDRLVGTYLHGALEDPAPALPSGGNICDAVPKKEQYERLQPTPMLRHAEDWLMAAGKGQKARGKSLTLTLDF